MNAEDVEKLIDERDTLTAELSRKTDLCTRQRDLEAKLQGEINDLEDALRDALDLAGDVDWFVRMQGGSDPGMKQVVEKAKAFIAEYSTQQIRPSRGGEDARNEADDIAANAQWMAGIIRSHLSHLPEAREALDASPGTSLAGRDARERLAELSAIFELPYDVDVIGHINERCSVLRTTIEQKDPS